MVKPGYNPAFFSRAGAYGKHVRGRCPHVPRPASNPILTRWQDAYSPCKARTPFRFLFGNVLGLAGGTDTAVGVAPRVDRSERPSAPLPRTCPKRTGYFSRRQRKSSACRSDRRTVCPGLASHGKSDGGNTRRKYVSTETMVPQKKCKSVHVLLEVSAFVLLPKAIMSGDRGLIP